MGESQKPVLLYQLDEGIAQQLHSVLTDGSIGLQTLVCSDSADLRLHLDEHQPDLVFCAFSKDLIHLLSAVEEMARVVVVARIPCAHEWIDAIECGAADYCAAPFEVQQLQWIVQSNRAAARSRELIYRQNPAVRLLP